MDLRPPSPNGYLGMMIQGLVALDDWSEPEYAEEERQKRTLWHTILSEARSRYTQLNIFCLTHECVARDIDDLSIRLSNYEKICLHDAMCAVIREGKMLKKAERNMKHAAKRRQRRRLTRNQNIVRYLLEDRLQAKVEANMRKVFIEVGTTLAEYVRISNCLHSDKDASVVIHDCVRLGKPIPSIASRVASDYTHILGWQAIARAAHELTHNDPIIEFDKIAYPYAMFGKYMHEVVWLHVFPEANGFNMERIETFLLAMRKRKTRLYEGDGDGAIVRRVMSMLTNF